MYRYEFENVFNEMFGISTRPSSSYNPVKIESKDSTSIITIDVPGYKKGDAKVEATDKVLKVKLDGVRGKKEYSFKLHDADLLEITSKLDDGILEIVVPAKTKNTVNIEIK